MGDDMALMKNAQGRKDGGYTRLFGDQQLGFLVSKIQAAVISSGTELEKIIKNKVNLIDDLDEFLKQEIMQDGVMVADKKQVKKCSTLDFAGAEPDFLIFKRRKGRQVCHLVELKDGDSFDTKKAAAEHTSMHSFISKNAHHLQYIVQTHFCSFNQESKPAIHEGFKKKISIDEAMTGREFCELLEIDYDEIVNARKAEAPKNFAYFLTELLKIQSARDFLKNRLGS